MKNSESKIKLKKELKLIFTEIENNQELKENNNSNHKNYFKEVLLKNKDNNENIKLIFNEFTSFLNLNSNNEEESESDIKYELIFINFIECFDESLIIKYLSNILILFQDNLLYFDIPYTFERLILKLNKNINIQTFEILNGFCIYNMKYKNKNKDILNKGILCYHQLIKYYQKFTNFNYNNEIIQSFYENLINKLNANNDNNNYDNDTIIQLLLCLNEVINVTNENKDFKIYTNDTILLLSKYLDINNNNNLDIILIALNILNNLGKTYKEEIKEIKNKIESPVYNLYNKINNECKSKNCNNSNEIYNKIMENCKFLLKNIESDLMIENCEINSEDKINIENKPFKSVNTTYIRYKNKEIENKNIDKNENKYNTLISELNQLSKNQLNLIDVISNLQTESNNNINELNKRLINLEKKLKNKLKEKDELPIIKDTKEEELKLNKQFKEYLQKGEITELFKIINNLGLNDIKTIDTKLIEKSLLILSIPLCKGEYTHEILTYIKTILILNKMNINNFIRNNLIDILNYLQTNEKQREISKEDYIDITLIVYYLINNNIII